MFPKHKKELAEQIRIWSSSAHTYTCRFGIGMLMKHFLSEKDDDEYLEIPARVASDDYYVRMMIAWYYATALAKKWSAAIVYLETNRLDRWAHNKTIQKARESYRISAERKMYLKSLRR